MLKCLACGNENDLAATTCANCGSDLRASRASYYLDLARTAAQQSDHVVAAEHLVAADTLIMPLTQAERDRYQLAAQAFYVQALIYYYKGQLGQARHELMLVEAQLNTSPDDTLLANVLTYFGNIAYRTSELDAAIGYYQRSYELAVRTEQPLLAAKATMNLGSIHSSRNDATTAINYYLRGLQQAELTSEPAIRVQAYRVLASFYSFYGPFNLALDYAERSLRMVAELNDPRIQCVVVGDAAGVYLCYGDLERAQLLLLSAYDQARRLGNRQLESDFAYSLAELMHERRDDANWLHYANIAYLAADDNYAQRANALLQLVSYQFSVGGKSRLNRYVTELDELHQQAGNDVASQALRGRALAAAAQGAWQDAIPPLDAVVEGKWLNLYDLAQAHEDYVAVLLPHTDEAQDRAAHLDRIRALLKRAAALYQQLGIPKRVAAVEAKLAALEERVTA